ncbi:NAD dependent epimerase/dehydratase family protein [Candidatus Methanoperedens nitroreducens]|uniref:NAD dependent epimerase/dehydratase family protein n=1 Tax=Candidatus Methanoperedens nitratireducens TaxID=1392998 RepID=A0A062V6I4_9EURY|nr:NAD dependent epimerase/dehydratase family protein [Candidatus Methanoperedens nitroreducens]
MKNERVLVTGGAGFTGSNLAEELAGKTLWKSA